MFGSSYPCSKLRFPVQSEAKHKVEPKVKAKPKGTPKAKTAPKRGCHEDDAEGEKPAKKHKK